MLNFAQLSSELAQITVSPLGSNLERLSLGGLSTRRRSAVSDSDVT